MGTIQKTITITDQQDQWIKRRIEKGNFTTDSEYISNLIERDQEQIQNSDIEAIRVELLKGEDSGEPAPFEGELFKAEMSVKYAYKIR